jgi:hypothetical protein
MKALKLFPASTSPKRLTIIVAVAAAVGMFAAPAASSAAPRPANVHAKIAVAPNDTYSKSQVTLDNRVITLWINNQTGDFHGEIADAATGDRIHLDYTNSAAQAKSGGSYSVDAVGVASDEGYANTSDHFVLYARACGFVGSTSKCTAWFERT